ncbi:MAG: hypothetical protein WCX88_03150 [Patescibacteria group bacterium]
MANLLHNLNTELEKNKRTPSTMVIIGIEIAKGKPKEKALDFSQISDKT